MRAVEASSRSTTRVIARIQHNTSAPIRWALTLLWTGGLLYLMLSPAGENSTASRISKLFGGTELTDAIGHVFLYAVLALLWIWALSLHLPERQAALMALTIALLLGFSLEFAQQFVSARGSTLIDYAANFLGVLLAGLVRTVLVRASSASKRI